VGTGPFPNRESVIRAVLQREREGQPLNSAAVKQDIRPLHRAGSRHFGSWSNTLAAAGIHPAHSNPKWDRVRMVEEILLRAVRGKPLGSRTVRPRSFRAAAVREFGSWPAALAAAGLELNGRHLKQTAACDRERLEGPSERERMREAIVRRRTLGLPLDWAAVKRDDPKLFIASRKWFRRWSYALAFAGLAPAKPSDGPI
jgi:hypothetical protein